MAQTPKLQDVQSIRHANLLLLLTECGSSRGAQAKLSRLTGVSQALISQLKRAVAHSGGATRTMGDDTARSLERGMDKPKGWMDHDHSIRTKTDVSRRIMEIVEALKGEQQMVVLQMAEALQNANGTPPIDDGPQQIKPRPPRRH